MNEDEYKNVRHPILDASILSKLTFRYFVFEWIFYSFLLWHFKINLYLNNSSAISWAWPLLKRSKNKEHFEINSLYSGTPSDDSEKLTNELEAYFFLEYF